MEDQERRVEKEIVRLATKLSMYHEQTEILCNLIGVTSPSQLEECLESQEVYQLIANDLADHLKDILNCPDADQTFVDTIITDIDAIRALKRTLGP